MTTTNPNWRLINSDLDSGEDQSITLISHALDQCEAVVQNRFRAIKSKLEKWSNRVEVKPAKLDSHVFYVQYSAILNMGYAANAILHLGTDSEMGPKLQGWVKAMQAFTTGVVCAYAAIDLAAQVFLVTRDVLNYRLHVSTDFDDANIHMTSFDKLERDFFISYLTPYFDSTLTDFGGKQRFKNARNLLRNKVVHGIYTYVVVRKLNLPENCGKRTWAVVNPKSTITEINDMRGCVKGKDWDKLPVEDFLHSVEADGSKIIVPAQELIRHILLFSIDTLEKVAAYADNTP